VWLGIQILTVRNELTQAEIAVTALRGGGDVGENLRKVADSGAAASKAASDPVWRVAEYVPIAGTNLRAVRLAAETLDELSDGVALPILDSVKAGGGLSSMIAPLTAAQPTVQSLSDQLSSVPTQDLIPQVREGLAQVKSVMRLAAPVVKYAPGLLGADGTKNYLVVAQNNAELMPLGGSAASHTLITVKAGKPKIVKQVASQDFDYVKPLDVELPVGLLELYGPIMKTHPNATVSRPDWPTAADLLTLLWNRDIGKQRIDGVVSLDPIALSYLLKAVGPVTMPTGEVLTSDTIVKVSLSDSYARYGDSADHGNGFFKVIAAAVFDRIAQGDFDAKEMLRAVQQAVHNRSLMFWSTDADLEKVVASTRLGGVLPTSNKKTTSIGVFFRDHSLGTKIDYYLQPSTTVMTTCRADGTTAYTVSVSATLDISKAAESKLPKYVRAHLPGQRYDTEVFVYGPPKSYIESYEPGENGTYVKRVKDLGRRVLKFVISTKPGQSGTVSVTYTIPAKAGTPGPTEVLSTPTVRANQVTLEGQQCQPAR